MAEKLTRNQAYYIARQYVQNKPVSWDDLEGSEDLWAYIQDDMTEAQVHSEAERAYQNRVKENDENDI